MVRACALGHSKWEQLASRGVKDAVGRCRRRGVRGAVNCPTGGGWTEMTRVEQRCEGIDERSVRTRRRAIARTSARATILRVGRGPTGVIVGGHAQPGDNGLGRGLVRATRRCRAHRRRCEVSFLQRGRAALAGRSAPPRAHERRHRPAGHYPPDTVGSEAQALLRPERRPVAAPRAKILHRPSSL